MRYVNKAGIAYFLHSRENMLPRNKAKVTTYFFRREKKEDYCPELPARFKVSETHTGLPVIKKV